VGEVYELLKKSIKDRKPMKYAGQNLSKLAEDLRDDAKKLTIARFYDHGLMLTMLKIFLEAGGDGHWLCQELLVQDLPMDRADGRSHADYSVHGDR
jgi:hypothetical protein